MRKIIPNWENEWWHQICQLKEKQREKTQTPPSLPSRDIAWKFAISPLDQHFTATWRFLLHRHAWTFFEFSCSGALKSTPKRFWVRSYFQVKQSFWGDAYLQILVKTSAWDSQHWDTGTSTRKKHFTEFGLIRLVFEDALMKNLGPAKIRKDVVTKVPLPDLSS